MYVNYREWSVTKSNGCNCTTLSLCLLSFNSKQVNSKFYRTVGNLETTITKRKCLIKKKNHRPMYDTGVW